MSHYGELIGTGGFGSVVRTKQNKAIKIGKNFKNQYDILSLKQLHLHPNFINIFGLEQIQQKSFLTMQGLWREDGWIELGSFIQQKNKRYYEILAAGLPQLVSAIQYMHSVNIVHRDIKPENIFIRITEAEPKIKILDFGLSCQRETCQGVVGSLYHIAPELLFAKKREFTMEECKKQDLWSLGITLYQCVYRSLPHQFYFASQGIGIDVLKKFWVYPRGIPAVHYFGILWMGIHPIHYQGDLMAHRTIQQKFLDFVPHQSKMRVDFNTYLLLEPSKRKIPNRRIIGMILTNFEKIYQTLLAADKQSWEEFLDNILTKTGQTLYELVHSIATSKEEFEKFWQEIVKATNGRKTNLALKLSKVLLARKDKKQDFMVQQAFVLKEQLSKQIFQS
jgi:hypothetical protein